ncbi:MAG: hypothetical protein LKG25_07100 [Prevotella sp.]|jgi:hypothetical protein|nr:hypothetical protein [Prevotella sp.]MCI1282349.1 hypothetical protein [Prevotella sp.]
MKKIFFPILLIVGLALTSCHKGPTPDDVAALVAKDYYEQLLQGHYEEYVDGHYQPDSIPASYREQLIRNAKMFIAQQQEEHRGIKQLRVVEAKADTVKHVANVFLAFSYGDSTTEEVVVPMVYQKGIWYLR